MYGQATSVVVTGLLRMVTKLGDTLIQSGLCLWLAITAHGAVNQGAAMVAELGDGGVERVECLFARRQVVDVGGVQ